MQVVSVNRGFLLRDVSLSIAFIHAAFFLLFPKHLPDPFGGDPFKAATHSVAPPLMTSLRSRQERPIYLQTRSQKPLPYRRGE